VFVRHCDNKEPHAEHEYVKRWRKKDLPWLRNPERFPSSWNSTYKCHGVLPDWSVEQLHSDCTQCAECTDHAIQHAVATNGIQGASSYYLVEDGKEPVMLHSSTVKLGGNQ
jgi:hypothetical protein